MFTATSKRSWQQVVILNSNYNFNIMRSIILLIGILAVLSCKTTKQGSDASGYNEPPPKTVMDAMDPELNLVTDVTWASPEGFDLTMDIYTPNTGRTNYPVIVMFHGGGWLINDKSIMKEPADYLARHGEYVVCNVNYRLLVDQENTVTIDEIIEDAFGAVLWVKSNIAKYKGDPSRLIVTGDSAGGHLASMVATHGDRLSSEGIKGEPWGFNPSWLPANTSAEQIARDQGLEVQAAIISYGAYDLTKRVSDGFETSSNIFWTLAQAEPRGLFGKGTTFDSHPELYERASANYNLLAAKDKTFPPMLFTAGER